MLDDMKQQLQEYKDIQNQSKNPVNTDIKKDKNRGFSM